MLVVPCWPPSWQVFYPKDSINNPLLLDLIFRQVRHHGVPQELGSSPRLGCPTAPYPFSRSSVTHSLTPASGSARRRGSA